MTCSGFILMDNPLLIVQLSPKKEEEEEEG
jgi:hypothetical protein